MAALYIEYSLTEEFTQDELHLVENPWNLDDFTLPGGWNYEGGGFAGAYFLYEERFFGPAETREEVKQLLNDYCCNVSHFKNFKISDRAIPPEDIHVYYDNLCTR